MVRFIVTLVSVGARPDDVVKVISDFEGVSLKEVRGSLEKAEEEGRYWELVLWQGDQAYPFLKQLEEAGAQVRMTERDRKATVLKWAARAMVLVAVVFLFLLLIKIKNLQEESHRLNGIFERVADIEDAIEKMTTEPPTPVTQEPAPETPVPQVVPTAAQPQVVTPATQTPATATPTTDRSWDDLDGLLK